MQIKGLTSNQSRDSSIHLLNEDMREFVSNNSEELSEAETLKPYIIPNTSELEPSVPPVPPQHPPSTLTQPNHPPNMHLKHR